jgi:acyl CoA:acetate/3-ketoacid CoA transferase alpha subunit
VLEYPIRADFALIKAHQGDRWGNLVYRKAARNFGPIMATAAKTTIVEVSQLVPWAISTRKASLPRAFLFSASTPWKT